jgi:4-hydroxybenzoate polyprenyltransferase
METIAIINLLLFSAIGMLCVFTGFDIKKWHNWLLGLYGFASGFFTGFVFVDSSGGLKLGLLFAFAVMYGGATTYWNRQRFK